MPATLEDALSNAIAVLHDAGESRRMPSGIQLDAEAVTFMLDCAFELEELRTKIRAESASQADPALTVPCREERLIEQARAGTWDGEGSVSEVVTVALATDQLDRLPRPYTTLDSA